MMEVVKLIPKMMVVSMTAPGMMVDVTRQAMRMIGTVTTPRMMVVVMTAPGMVVYVTKKAMKRRLRIETRARVEKEEKQFYKEVVKERIEKKRKETKNAEKKKEKENFLKNSSRTAIPHLAELLT